MARIESSENNHPRLAKLKSIAPLKTLEEARAIAVFGLSDL
jgi:hypothetical protein